MSVHTLHFGCSSCMNFEPHKVKVTVTEGRDASRHGPAEGDDFYFDTPVGCPKCGVVYTETERDELEREIEDECEERFKHIYQTAYVGQPR